MLSNDTNSVSGNTFIQSCNNPIRISDGGAGFHLVNCIPKVFFFNPCKGNESDSGAIPASDLMAPHHDTAYLTIDKLLETDQAWLYRVICLDADTYDAAIYDFGSIIHTHEIIKRDDSQGTVLVT